MPRSAPLSRLRVLPYVLPPLVMSAWVYAPIIGNYFHADDFQHLYLIADGRVPEFLATPHGGHMLVARNALFVLFHALFGVDPRGYFWLVLVTHLVNVGLLFAVIDACCGSRRIACGGAALWGTSPLNADALGWYSVYGQVALTTLILAVLWRIARAARSGSAVSHSEVVGWFVLVILGSTCFGIGIGFALAAAVALPLWLAGPSHRFARRLFASLVIVVPGLYLLVHVLFRLAVGYAHDSATYPGAAFSAGLAVPYMTGHLAAFGISKTLAGAWLPDAPYPGALLGVVAAAYILTTAVAVAVVDGATRRAILACLVLALGGYGIIAVGRAMVAPGALSVLTAQATQTRYHYAPPVPLVIAACLVLGAAVRALPAMPRWTGSAALGVYLTALALALQRRPPTIDHYDAERQEVAALQSAVAAQVGQAAAGDAAYIVNRHMLPVNYFTSMEIFPGWAGLFVVYFPDNAVDGRAVRFVEAQATRVALARQRPHTRTADLLVTRAEAEHSGVPAER